MLVPLDERSLLYQLVDQVRELADAGLDAIGWYRRKTKAKVVYGRIVRHEMDLSRFDEDAVGQRLLL